MTHAKWLETLRQAYNEDLNDSLKELPDACGHVWTFENIYGIKYTGTVWFLDVPRIARKMFEYRTSSPGGAALI